MLVKKSVKGSRWSMVLVAAVFALVMPVAAFAQTPMPAGDIITLAAGAADDIIPWAQTLQVILAAAGVSFAIWMIRRGLKLGR